MTPGAHPVATCLTKNSLLARGLVQVSLTSESKTSNSSKLVLHTKMPHSGMPPCLHAGQLRSRLESCSHDLQADLSPSTPET